MERPNVPKFGNWDKADEVPYTVYFDKARKGRGAGRKMINPNDPEENPDLFTDNSNDQMIRSRNSSIDETPIHQRRGSNSSTTRPTRISGGSDRSIDRSPLHPQYRGKAVGVAADGASPSRDNRSPRHSSQGNRTPGRTRMKPHGTPERGGGGGGAAIPPFGQWDENDPESAENYTHIFKQASQEKQTGSSNAPPAISSEPSNYKNPKQKANDQGCCFGWF